MARRRRENVCRACTYQDPLDAAALPGQDSSTKLQTTDYTTVLAKTPLNGDLQPK